MSDRQLHEWAGQFERTALSWNRTALALAVNGALLIRSARGAAFWPAVGGTVACLATLLLWMLTAWAYRRGSSTKPGSLLASSPVSVGLMVALIVVVSAFDLAVVLLVPDVE